MHLNNKYQHNAHVAAQSCTRRSEIAHMSEHNYMSQHDNPHLQHNNSQVAAQQPTRCSTTTQQGGQDHTAQPKAHSNINITDHHCG